MDPILQQLIRYGVDPSLAQFALAAARMAQVLVYGEEGPGATATAPSGAAVRAENGAADAVPTASGRRA